jgi:hypothetical protein
MAVHERNSTIIIATKFLNLYQDGENALMGSGCRLKGNDIPVQYMNYNYSCNYFSFVLFDRGNPVY